jgi:hypothetical protein
MPGWIELKTGHIHRAIEAIRPMPPYLRGRIDPKGGFVVDPGELKKWAEGTAQSSRGELTSGPRAGEGEIRSSASEGFTLRERAQVVTQVLALPQVSVAMKGHRLRALRVVMELGEKAAPPQHLATVVLFNYTLGKATRFVIDTETGALVREQPLHGRPQPSEEELQEASRIVRGDVVHKRLLEVGDVLEGSFIVDGPPGAPPLHRYLQMQVLSPDRHRIERLVVVDLATGTIASSRPT